jgi:hypothetical protein
MARFMFASRPVAQDLARYGVSPNKSLTARPTGGIDEIAAFWRGLVDGDGHLMNAKDSSGYIKPTIGITGSLAIAEGFKAFVKQYEPGHKGTPQKIGRIYMHRVHGRMAVTIIRMLYPGGAIALPRKAALAREILSSYESRQEAKIVPVACSVPECGRDVEALGFCVRHYKRFRKHGSPTAIGTRWHGVQVDVEVVMATDAKPMRKRRSDAKPDAYKTMTK